MSIAMRIVGLGVMLAVLAAPPAAGQRAGDQGFGLMLGSPTGLSMKVWLDETAAIDGAFGIARGELDVHLTLLWHIHKWLRPAGPDSQVQQIYDSGAFPLYLGIGPRVLFRDKEELGIRLPVGLSFLPHQTNWEYFGELAPVIRLTPHSGLNFDFAIGFRYYFRTIRPRTGP